LNPDIANRNKDSNRACPTLSSILFLQLVYIFEQHALRRLSVEAPTNRSCTYECPWWQNICVVSYLTALYEIREKQ